MRKIGPNCKFQPTVTFFHKRLSFRYTCLIILYCASGCL